ncbi:hypothetical protein Trydic_g6329 [Trypoxylus dichotomus]
MTLDALKGLIDGEDLEEFLDKLNEGFFEETLANENPSRKTAITQNICNQIQDSKRRRYEEVFTLDITPIFREFKKKPRRSQQVPKKEDGERKWAAQKANRTIGRSYGMRIAVPEMSGNRNIEGNIAFVSMSLCLPTGSADCERVIY